MTEIIKHRLQVPGVPRILRAGDPGNLHREQNRLRPGCDSKEIRLRRATQPTLLLRLGVRRNERGAHLRGGHPARHKEQGEPARRGARGDLLTHQR